MRASKFAAVLAIAGLIVSAANAAPGGGNGGGEGPGHGGEGPGHGGEGPGHGGGNGGNGGGPGQGGGSPAQGNGRPPRGVPCDPAVIARVPGCIACNDTTPDSACVACGRGRGHLVDPTTGQCGCAAGYGVGMSDNVVNRPASMAVNCTAGDPAQCRCRPCIKGTTRGEARHYDGATCTLNGGTSFDFPASDNGLATFSLSGSNSNNATMTITLQNAVGGGNSSSVFNIDADGLLLGTDCTTEVVSFEVAVTASTQFSLYSVFVSKRVTNAPNKMIYSIESGDGLCASRDNRPRLEGRAVPPRPNRGQRCVVQTGSVLKFTARYGKSGGAGCVGGQPNYVRIRSITFVQNA